MRRRTALEPMDAPGKPMYVTQTTTYAIATARNSAPFAAVYAAKTIAARKSVRPKARAREGARGSGASSAPCCAIGAFAPRSPAGVFRGGLFFAIVSTPFL